MDILAKGKRVDTGEWVEGYYCKRKTGHYTDIGFVEEYKDCIITEFADGEVAWCDIDNSTICQRTGLKDKNGKLIWENDIVQYCDCIAENYVITWDADKARFEYRQYGCSMMDFDELSGMEVEVIGNIFDNPELLEGGAE